MNRRDIIIIAVLINAGLLVLLFASALKTDQGQADIAASREVPTKTPYMPSQIEVPAVRGDEVDQVLSQFAASTPAGSTPSTPVAAPLLQSFPTQDSGLSDVSGVAPITDFTDEASPVISSLDAQAATGPSLKEIRVKKGDALEKIARAHQTTVQDLMRVNQLTSTQLKIGQVLKIPEKGGKASAQVSTPAKVNEAEAKYYTVKNGDNPWTIAVKNHMKVEELLRLNQLDEDKARRLKPGDQLRIR